MAYPTRPREPLLDQETALMLERRGLELLGLGLVILGVLSAAMAWSYTPDDPNWFVATDRPAQNMLGRTGASIAGILFTVIGWGTACLAVIFAVWGARLTLHRDLDRVWRLVLAPVWIAAVAGYGATLPASQAWASAHNFGMGGLLGDTAIGFLLTVLPISTVFSVKLVSLLLAFGALWLGAFVLGFSRGEVKTGAIWLLVGVLRTLLMGLSVLKWVSDRIGFAWGSYSERRAQAREAAQEHEDWEAQQRALSVALGAQAEQEVKPGLLGRVPGLRKRADEAPAQPDTLDAQPETRVQARIADAIKARVRAGMVVRPAEIPRATKLEEPPLTRDMAVTLPPVPEDAPGGMPDYVPADMSGEVLEFDAQPVLPASPPAIPRAELKRATIQQPTRKPVPVSTRAKAEAEPRLALQDTVSDFDLPPLELLASPDSITRHVLSDEALEENARMLESVLDDYGVKGEITSVRPGPVVTMYELEPAPGLKASRVIGLADDIARSMAALSARVSTVPGRSVIGIELPNEKREKVILREILATRDFGDGTQKLPLALGKNIGGDPVVANLAKMPHLLIAGTTGSGKSVAINTMILSLLYKLGPQDCRLIMIDPKMLELSVYDGIPHLLSPVVTDPKKAVVALKWVVGEMEERYRKMSKMGVRNIDGYNGRVKDALDKGEMFSRTVQTGFDDDTGEPVFETEEFEPKKLPYIVVIVDEMADLMMVAGKEIEACIQRLAQMARASGIHLIMATQRPSVDVITGTIKANFPTRISFQVTSKIDSRTILGEMGAEQLLGMGDMLYMAGGAKITRCHAPFVSDEEVEEIVNHLKAYGPPDYVGGVIDGPDEEKAGGIDEVLGLGGNTSGEDALYDQAVAIVIKDRKCSTSYIQRKLAIGYNKAARLVEQMEDEGVVSPSNHVGKREVLVPEP